MASFKYVCLMMNFAQCCQLPNNTQTFLKVDINKVTIVPEVNRVINGRQS